MYKLPINKIEMHYKAKKKRDWSITIDHCLDTGDTYQYIQFIAFPHNNTYFVNVPGDSNKVLQTGVFEL